MAERSHLRPRWWLLYLALPLGGILFWLIESAHPSDPVRRALQIGVVLLVFGYVDWWRRANALALLRLDTEGQRLYQISEVSRRSDADPGTDRAPATTGTFYSGLFAARVVVSEWEPSVIDNTSRDEIR